MSSALQKSFFKKLRANYKQLTAQEIGRILGLSTSGAYSKMNGTNNLTFEELMTLATRLDISLDSIVYNNPENEAPFSFYSNSLKFTHKSYYEFLKNASNHLAQIQNVKQLNITYIAQELPLTLLLQFPYLLSFKINFWDYTNWQINPTFSEDRLIFHAINEDMTTMASNFYQTYLNIDTTEIWNTSMLSATYRQLMYCVEMGYIQNELLAKSILKDLQGLIDYMEAMVSQGKKYLIKKPEITNKKIRIYANDIATQNEMIFARGHNFSIVYTAFDTPNYIRSTDNRVIDYMQSLKNKIINQSTDLFKDENFSEKNDFFLKLRTEYASWKEAILTEN